MRRRRRGAGRFVAAALVPLALVAVAPTGSPEVVGGRARRLGLPTEDGDARQSYLMPTALVRRLTVVEVLLHRYQDAAAPGAMEQAKTNAWSAAVDALRGVQVVADIGASDPMTSPLRMGDVITSTNGSLPSASIIQSQLAAGRAVDLRILRDGALTDVRLTPNEAPALQLLPLYSTPHGPGIDTGHTDGASAGLLLAIADIDLLTPGDLAGGHLIAATGTIGPDGTVGPVEAYRQKTAAAARAGATVMLVPAMDLERVQALAPAGLRIIGVETLTHAIWELCALGGTSALCGNAPR